MDWWNDLTVITELDEGEEANCDFQFLDDGKSLKVRFAASDVSDKYFQADRIDFLDRDDIDVDILEEIADLNTVLEFKTVEEIKKLMFLSEDETEEEEDDQPAAEEAQAEEPKKTARKKPSEKKAPAKKEEVVEEPEVEIEDPAVEEAETEAPDGSQDESWNDKEDNGTDW